MKDRNFIKDYAEQQYKTSQNLSARINLWSYGSNPIPLQQWIFSKIQLQKYERVLELGCGTGKLWFENLNKIPSECSIILSDFSEGMVNNAKENLQSLNLPIEYKIIDAEEIPYPNQIFDVVIACHMLYHIPNIQNALRSISRILKPDGRFFATTISQRHTQELKEFLSTFELYFDDELKILNEFRNETGREILKPFFSDIKLYEYINPVNIPSVEPLMTYIESMFTKDKFPEFQEKRPEVEEAIINILKKRSKFEITGITGLFEAKKPII